MKFLRTLIASTLGVLLALFIVFIVLFLSIVSSSKEPEPYIRDNSVLKISISGNLPSHVSGNPFDELFGGQQRSKVSLKSLKENLKKAAVHDKIRGVWLNIDFLSPGWANLEEAHRLITTFRKESGKFVYATTNDLGYNETGYFLASAADSVFSPPESLFEFDGFYTQAMFFTGLFEKLGIEAEVTRFGKYKSAVEPLYRKDFSEENKYQLQQIVGQTNERFIEAVSGKTGKSPDSINRLLNDTPGLLVRRGYENGLIDSLLYTGQVESLIKQRIGLSENQTLHTVSNSRYAKVKPHTAGLNSPASADKIAVIYAGGPITFEPESDFVIGGEQIITASFFEEQLSKIKNDNNIKAVVVRINSPGGSGSTSDVIWQMLRKTSEDLPVVASMGNVAASGGYYIAMAADTIVAESTTITGSIGVWAYKLNMQTFFNDELGLTFDEVKSHRHADWLDPARGFTESEARAYQQFVDSFYNTFLSRTAESRGLTVAKVDEVAQGRVWTGKDALEQNLVDMLGGLDTALQTAAQMAGIEDYQTEVFPKPKDLFQLLMSTADTRIKAWLGSTPFFNETVRESGRILSSRRGDALLVFPYDLNIQ